MNKFSKILLILFPVIIAASVVMGIFFGAYLIRSSTNSSVFFGDKKEFNPANKLNEILNFVERTYVDTVDKKKLSESSITSILEQLDPHSYYIAASDFGDMNDPLEGNFEGIGIEFRIKDDTVLVISAIPNGPSAKIGLKAGDRIVEIQKRKKEI